MELLDLPPELFERVIELYVKKYGVKEAWKLRGICSTFLVASTKNPQSANIIIP
jgi:hypothetical protein